VIDVLIPLLGRPETVKPLVDNILSTSFEARIILLCSPNDDEVIEEASAVADMINVIRAVMREGPGPGDYAKKINAGFDLTTRPFVLLAASDLRFHAAWDVRAIEIALKTDAGVIGTNDLGNPTVMQGKHSTHPLVRRSYIEEQGGTLDRIPGVVLFEGYGHQNCNPPEAPVWMADLSFRPLGDVRVGDQVMGWARSGPKDLKRLCVSRVLAVHRREAPLVRLFMESGRRIRCTPDHLWLNGAWSPSSGERGISEWVTPSVGRTLLHVMDGAFAVPLHLERLAGWVSGIYDGEGSGVYAVAQMAKANPDVIEEAMRAFDVLSIPHVVEHNKDGMTKLILTGGRQGYLDFLLRIRPVKRRKLTAKIVGSSRFGKRDQIEAVADDGFGEVISMTTETGNYVAWGYASRNCDTELVTLAKARKQWAFAHDSHVEHLHPFWKKGEMDDVYRKGQHTSRADSLLYRQRLRMLRKKDP
jgi:hypothetical protein